MSTDTSYYSGISFPPRKNKSGFWEVSTDLDLIKESIYVILNTSQGSMPMNPAFGTSIDSNLFETVDKAMQGVLCQQIQKDIETWEPRVIVNSITSYSHDDIRLFDISMTIRLTGTQFSMQVPFVQQS